ncbi:hypothetical protein [Kineococcus arenarius]|uniref:hypothetical protein n=1 Tax=unclassified Kineococcus TaxID=2621656 RepID=UPI003D7D3482
MREYRAEGTSVHVYESNDYDGGHHPSPSRRLGTAGAYSTSEDAQRAAQDMQDAYNDGYREARVSFINALDRGSYSGRAHDEDDDY